VVAAPVVRPAPIVAPPVAKPAPVPERREVATAAPALKPAAPKLDAKTVEQIFSCLAPGLPPDWKRTWVVVTNGETAISGKFYVTNTLRGEDAEEYTPCNAQEVARRIVSLSEGQPHWRAARLDIDSEGAYELRYER